MLIIGLIATLLSSLSTTSWAATGDWDLCSKTDCTNQQAEIQQRFNSNPQFELASNLAVPKHRYAGSCWQKNSTATADPNYEFFSLFHFYDSAASSPVQMRGIFAFGEKTNPFCSMSETDAEAYLDLRAPTTYALEMQTDFALFHLKFPKSEHFTWFRTSPDASELYLVGFSRYERSWEMEWCAYRRL